jgi:hypothetical protein
MTRCTFKQGQYNCGSYAFNLWKEDIEQGEYCDHHYWQDQAQKARAEEREACALVCIDIANKPSNVVLGVAINCATAIRARGQAS